MSKPKVGFYWCASCGGCEEVVVDLAEDVLKVVEAVDIVFWPCAMDFKREDVEAMADGEIAVCFVNGAIRSSEQREMAELLRRKSGLLIAFGACSYTGGIPGLANQFSKEQIMKYVYEGSPSTVNPDRVRPQTEVAVAEGTLTLPLLDDSVKTLDQTVPVDYYIPGCAPPVKLLVGAVMAVLEGNLPPKGSVLAPNKALCDECPRIDSKPQDLSIEAFHRPHEVMIDPETCLLAQGLLCLGSATRSGCDAACVRGNMPCTGCMGPVDQVRDHGAAALSATASLGAAMDEKAAAKLMDGIPDPVGTFYRYGLPASFLHKHTRPNGNGAG